MIRRVIKSLLLLLVGLLLLVAGGWAWLWHTESGAEWAWRQAGGAIADSRDATLTAELSGTLRRGLDLRDVAYRDENVTVTASRALLEVGFRASPMSLTVRRLHLDEISLDIVEGEPKDAGESSTWPDSLALPLPVNVRELQVQGAEVRRGEVVFPIGSIEASGRWHERLSLKVSSFQSEELSGSLSLDADMNAPYPLQSEVRVTRYTLPPAAQEKAPWLPASMASVLEIDGDLESLWFDGHLQWPDFIPEAAVSGQIDRPTAGPRWTLEAAIPNVSFPREWLPEMDTHETYDPDRPLALRGLNLTATGQNLSLEFDGTGAADSPWTQNATVRFRGNLDEGGLQQWEAEGEAGLQAEGWPQAEIEFGGTGGQDDMAFQLTAPQLFGGTLSTSVVAPANGDFPWRGEIKAQRVAVKPLLEVLAPHLGTPDDTDVAGITDMLQSDTIDASIRFAAGFEPLSLDVEVRQFTGSVRGKTVTAIGDVMYGDDRLRAAGLKLRSGDSSAEFDGPLYGPPGLSIELDIASLDDFLAGASGSLAGTVQYQHDADRGIAGSRARGDLRGSNLQALGWGVDSLRIFPPESAASDKPLAASLVAEGVTGGSLEIEQITATLAGNFERHTLDLSVTMPGAMLTAAASGRASNGSDATWRGTLESFAFEPLEHPAWRLREPAALEYSGQLKLESACLTPGGESAVCVDLEQRRDGSQQGRLEVSSASLDLLAHLAGWPLSLSQRLDGALSWTVAADGRPSATALFEISEGVIVDRVEDLELLNTQRGTFRFDVERGRLHSGQLDIPLDSGAIDIDFEVPDILAGRQSAIQGRIIANLDDLDALTIFIPQLVQTDGELRSVLLVDGSLADPKLSGVVEMINGRTTVLASGLRLTEARLTGRLDDSNRFQVRGTFRAGEGRGEVRAVVDVSDPLNPTMEVGLKGNGLTLIDVPDLVLHADTDISANWDEEAMTLSGRVHVPSARFAPRYLPSETAAESPDVVIVAGAPEQAQSPARQTGFIMQGELEVSMGEDVVVDLDVAEAELTGSAIFKWNGPPVPLASGQYGLVGEIQAYGQTLEITRATVRFPDVPANNPHLDIRAERRIYGNPQISHAGVLVHGTLKRPITEPYTVPMTNADRARALLITGSDFNYEQGVGAVSVGTYISPKLYLAYGVGLFEEGNVITVRYDLKRNFGVKATSGQDDTGIDISYTIEK